MGRRESVAVRFCLSPPVEAGLAWCGCRLESGWAGVSRSQFDSAFFLELWRVILAGVRFGLLNRGTGEEPVPVRFWCSPPKTKSSNYSGNPGSVEPGYTYVKNFLFVGDCHADLDFIERAADLAAEHNAEMIQLGDFGFLWPGRGGDMLDQVSGVLKMSGEKFARPPVVCRWICGNHDWHTKIATLCKTAPKNGTGFELADNIIYQPRGSTYTDEDGTRFLFVGGASSIDQANRTTGLSWWPEEDITESDYVAAKAAEGPIHVMVTHDAPDYPLGFSPKGSAAFRVRSAQGMEYLRRLMYHHEPEMLIHGHWHARYSRQDGNTKVVGLDCNYGKFPDAVMLWSRELLSGQ